MEFKSRKEMTDLIESLNHLKKWYEKSLKESSQNFPHTPNFRTKQYEFILRAVEIELEFLNEVLEHIDKKP